LSDRFLTRRDEVITDLAKSRVGKSHS
jgi:hypothetical protein